MAPSGGVVFCLAYLVGLLSTALSWRSFGLPLGSIGLLFIGIILAGWLPRCRPTWGTPRTYLIAGSIALLASLYFQLRLPHPGSQDISQFLPESQPAAVVTVRGRVISTPRLTRSQRSQFWLEAEELSEGNLDATAPSTAQTVTGKLYVTAPLLLATGLYPGQTIEIAGTLYKPRPAMNPGGFDFQAYLAREGGFAAFRGRQVNLPSSEIPPKFSWWAIRRHIIQTQVQWLNSPEGFLISSMVLGGRVVDLPYDIRDQFSKVGLAHALAASGMQVSLILGLVLGVTRRLSLKLQFAVGAIALLVFLGLTGIQPSVLRATIMGLGTLTALLLQRQVKSTHALLLTAVLLLLVNPLWIWDLGFQFSFLATLGLLVTAPTLTQWLDWVPSAIAPLLTVPLAAYLWTLPLQLYAYGLVSPYSLPINVITTPLISIISLGGAFSAFISLLSPWMGSAIAWLLYYPTHWLLEVAQFSSQLPGSAIATGTLSPIQMIFLYGLLCLVWLNGWCQKRWWVVGALALGLIFIPAWQVQNQRVQVTVLATSDSPVMVIQDRGKVALLNSGDEKTAHFTVLPFLQQQGINRVDWAIATQLSVDSSNGWSKVLSHIPIGTLYINRTPGTPEKQPAGQKPLGNFRESTFKRKQGTQATMLVGKPLQMGSFSITLLHSSPAVIEIARHGQRWIWMSETTSGEQPGLTQIKHLSPAQVLLWAGEPLSQPLTQKIQPKVAIAVTPSLSPEILTAFQQHQISLLWTGRDGALQWTPNQGFATTMTAVD